MNDGLMVDAYQLCRCLYKFSATHEDFARSNCYPKILPTTFMQCMLTRDITLLLEYVVFINMFIKSDM